MGVKLKNICFAAFASITWLLMSNGDLNLKPRTELVNHTSPAAPFTLRDAD